MHAWLARTAPKKVSGLEGALGSDAIALRASRSRRYWCTDQTIEGVHYESDVSPSVAGAKACARALSDLAASGATPEAVLLALSVPVGEAEARLKRGIGGVRRMARKHGAELVGGDLSAAGDHWHWTVTAIGRQSTERRSVDRRGGRAGDVLVVSGAVGGSQLGRHLKIQPRIEAGRALFDAGARAMLDTTDGTALDLVRLAEGSGVGLRLDDLPVHAHAKRAARTSGRSALEHALTDGEDHELFALLPPSAWKRLSRSLVRRIPGLTAIGRATRRPGVLLELEDGRTLDLADYEGWDHGRSNH